MPSEILKPVPLLHQSEFSTPPALEKQSLSFHTQDSGEPFSSVLSGIQLLVIGVLLLVLAVKVATRIRERRFNRHVTENIDAKVGTKARIPPLGSMAMASMAKKSCRYRVLATSAGRIQRSAGVGRLHAK